MPRSARPEKFGKKFRIRWLDEHGVRRHDLFTTYTDADRALRKRQAEVDQIRSGLMDPALEVHTFNELVAYWKEHRLPRKRSPKDDKSILSAHLKPFFGKLRLQDVTVSKVDEYMKSRRHLSPKTVHNHITLLISMLNAAEDIGWLRTKPRIKKPKLGRDEYSYLRTDEEIRRFLEAAKEEGAVAFAMYCTAVYTGMRAGELAGLRWECVAIDRRMITVQRSYKKPTKTMDIRHVPILDPLLPVLREWKLKNPHPWVFPNERGGMNGPSARILQEVFHRVLKDAEFPEDYITFHCLRHTFASHWMMKGGDVYRLQKILGHASIQSTQRYAHLTPDIYEQDYNRLVDVVPKNTLATPIPLRKKGKGRSR